MVKKLQLICSIILLLITFTNITLPVINNLHLFTEKFNPKFYEKKYNNSQYVIPQSKTPISDEELVSYAGYRYATGMNPVLINSDHPPLGKYLIGWFTLITCNNRIVSIVFALGNLILIFLITYLLTHNALLSILSIFFLSFDSMFIDQIIHSPILDIIQVFFLMLYFLIFALWLKKESLVKLVLMGITLGCMSSVKLYFPVFVVMFSTGLSLLLLKKSIKQIIIFLSIVILMIFLTYTLSYFSFFMHGNNFRSFLGTQKWIFLFWKNNSVHNSQFIGDALTLILFNQWKVWWGNVAYIHFERWTILWPIFFILGDMASLFVIKEFIVEKKHTFLSQFGLILSIWIFIATIYLSFLPISPRYIMILFFPIYIIIPLMIQLMSNPNVKIQRYKSSSKSK
jgi:hypothetical protein